MENSRDIVDLLCQPLLRPVRLWSRQEVMLRPSPLPRASGVYAWYFRSSLLGIPTDGCVTLGDSALLYVGISPSAPPQNGKLPSKQNLFQRIRYHYRGNAEGSTLRLTLGCLLSTQLDIEL